MRGLTLMAIGSYWRCTIMKSHLWKWDGGDWKREKKLRKRRISFAPNRFPITVHSAVFNNAGTKIVAGYEDSDIIVWDTDVLHFLRAGVEEAVENQRGARHRGARHRGARHRGARHRGARHRGARHRGARHRGARHRGARHRGARHRGIEAQGINNHYRLVGNIVENQLFFCNL